MSDKRTHRNLEEILKYLNKDLSGKERYDLEREMELDPFLKDAVEGFDTVSGKDIERDIMVLRDRLRKRISRRRRITIYSAAAAIASLLIVSSIFLKLHDFRPEEASEKITERASMQEGQGMVSDEEILEIKAEDGEHSDEAEPQPVSKDRVIEKEDRQTMKKSEAADEEKPADIVVVEAEAKADETMETAADKSADIGRKVSMAMDPDTESLNEVVVTGYGASETILSEKEAVTILQFADHQKAVSSGAPSPVSGITDYRKYIAENIQFPEDVPGIDRTVVKLQITVAETGRISDIEVLRTGGDSFTNEAIRLVREGPEWKPAVKDGVPIEERVLLRIVFSR